MVPHLRATAATFSKAGIIPMSSSSGKSVSLLLEDRWLRTEKVSSSWVELRSQVCKSSNSSSVNYPKRIGVRGSVQCSYLKKDRKYLGKSSSDSSDSDEENSCSNSGRSTSFDTSKSLLSEAHKGGIPSSLSSSSESGSGTISSCNGPWVYVTKNKG